MVFASTDAFGAIVWVVVILVLAVVIGIWRMGSAASKRERREAAAERERRDSAPL